MAGEEYSGLKPCGAGEMLQPLTVIFNVIDS